MNKNLKYYCKNCNKEISSRTALYSSGLCLVCVHLGKKYSKDRKIKISISTKLYNKDNIKKSISAWRRNSEPKLKFDNDMQAAEELIKNWEQHKESFNQIIFAITQEENE